MCVAFPSCPCRYHAHCQRSQRAAVLAFTHACQLKAWRAWRAHAQRRQAKTCMAQHAAALWAGHVATHTFTAWRAWAAASQRHRAVNAVAAQHYSQQLQRRALLSLWLAVLRRRQECAAEHQAVGHMQGVRWAGTRGGKRQWAGVCALAGARV